MEKEKWIKAVQKEIRFPLDRKKIGKELAEHIEDSIKAYEEAGMTPEEAKQKSIENMGDPAALGKSLNRQHKPWLGFLWLISEAAAAIAVLLLICVVTYGWLHPKEEITAFRPDENFYQRELQNYIATNNENVLHYWQPAKKIEMENTEIVIKGLIYDETLKTMHLFLTSSGDYALGDFFEIKLNGKGGDLASHRVEKNGTGQWEGYYEITFENFDKQTSCNISYDRFGYSFSAMIDLGSGERTNTSFQEKGERTHA